MIVGDLIMLGAGSGLTLLVQHFLPKNGTGPSIPTTLDGFGQILSHEGQSLVDRFDALEASLSPNLERFSKMLSEAVTTALANVEAAAEAKAAKAVEAYKAANPPVDVQTVSDAQSAEDAAAAQALADKLNAA